MTKTEPRDLIHDLIAYYIASRKSRTVASGWAAKAIQAATGVDSNTPADEATRRLMEAVERALAARVLPVEEESRPPAFSGEHDADACEARMLAGNLRWLIDARWKVTLGRHPTGHQGENGLEPYYAEQVGNSMSSRLWHGVSPSDAIARALQYAEQKQEEAPGEH